MCRYSTWLIYSYITLCWLCNRNNSVKKTHGKFLYETFSYNIYSKTHNCSDKRSWLFLLISRDHWFPESGTFSHAEGHKGVGNILKSTINASRWTTITIICSCLFEVDHHLLLQVTTYKGMEVLKPTGHGASETNFDLRTQWGTI